MATKIQGMKVVGVCQHHEDAQKPFALRIQFPNGVVTQPCSLTVFMSALNEMLQNNEVTIDVEVAI